MLAIAAAVLGVCACGGDDDDGAGTIDSGARPIDAAPIDAAIDDSDAGNAALPETLPDPLPAGPVTATVAAYNLGLIQTIINAPERKPLQVEALAALDTDVLCINEAWLQYTSTREFAELLADAFPYAMWTHTHESNFGNDVVIVSKHPLYRGRELRYATNPEDTVDRMAVAATVVTDDAAFHVVCTHLTSANDPDFVAARQAQIAELETWMQAEGYTGEPTFLVGDLNCGPETAPCPTCSVQEDQATFELLLQSWSDPGASVAITAGDGRSCTYCWDAAEPMLLIPPTEDEVDVRIDHVLYRDLGAAAPVECDILLSDPVTYQAAGSTAQTQLSDHRGVRCRFGPPAAE